MAETVTQLLQERADDDNLAITYEGSRWTWREYIRDAEKTAAVMRPSSTLNAAIDAF